MQVGEELPEEDGSFYRELSKNFQLEIQKELGYAFKIKEGVE